MLSVVLAKKHCVSFTLENALHFPEVFLVHFIDLYNPFKKIMNFGSTQVVTM